MSSADPKQAWQFDEGELPKWARPREHRSDDEFDFGIEIPAVTPAPRWPILGRLFLLRICIAILFWIFIGIGRAGYESGSWVGTTITAALWGCLIGVVLYIGLLFLRDYVKMHGPVYGNWEPSAPTIRILYLPPLILPAFLIGSRIVFWLFAARALGVAAAAIVCFAVFAQWGARPIAFMQKLLLANVATPPSMQQKRSRTDLNPDLFKLGVLLATVVVVPVYLSNAWAIVAVMGLCAFDLYHSMTPLLRYGSWRTVFSALVVRAGQVVLEYMDYAPTDRHHWQPADNIATRRFMLVAIIGSFDFALLTGLAYYIPWEPFAAFFVPDVRVNYLLVPIYDQGNFNWLTAPWALAHIPGVDSGYSACFLMAIILFFLLPPVALFLVYFDSLVQLESLSQKIKQ